MIIGRNDGGVIIGNLNSEHALVQECGPEHKQSAESSNKVMGCPILRAKCYLINGKVRMCYYCKLTLL